MTDLTRRDFMKAGSVAGAVLAGTAAAGKLAVQQTRAADNANGFQAATSVMSRGPGSHPKRGPGIQSIYAVCEVTGGGEKVYGIAVEYDALINPGSLARDTFSAGVFPAAPGFVPGM